MSCDTYALLPCNVRINDVIKVLGKLYGCHHIWLNGNGARYLTVPDATTTGDVARPGVADILLKRGFGKCPTCEAPKSLDTALMFYHFEISEGDGCWRRVSLGRSISERIAIGISLVNFFGGELIYRDSSNDER